MLADNEGKFKGSLLEELLNQLIERLVEEGYLTLHEELRRQPKNKQRGNGQGEISDPLPRDVRFEVTEKGLDFLGYKTLRNLLGSFGQKCRPDVTTQIIYPRASKLPQPANVTNLATRLISTSIRLCFRPFSAKV